MATSPSTPTRKQFLQGLGTIVTGIFLFKPLTRSAQPSTQSLAAKDPLFQLAKIDSRSVSRLQLKS